ncbi:hypothetical protein BVC71_13995 [Marivivens niveibacter]|uniref:DUF3489 domain-containing protein n=1 Tax=Marivivens niveibacter TaxID=1930667 RepID=A0A251WUW1_9RHOB|nr:hypothetical protein [Marivivens niveibacter]OUD08280.1 hypothetical protein BVC71_13995 [Marivivens niveibacter]
MTLGKYSFEIDPATEDEVCLKIISACGGTTTAEELARMLSNSGWTRDRAHRKLKVLAMRGKLARVEDVDGGKISYEIAH